jgi:hypothetical protein
VFEWYYVGQYGQLGPLSEEQMVELVESGVVVTETYVWKRGMPDWIRADSVPLFRQRLTPSAPPAPPPTPAASSPHDPRGGWHSPPQYQIQPASPHTVAYAGGIISPHSKVLAGVLNLLIPGVGRMILGYTAIGVLQLVLAICSFGLLHLWSFIDGILILAGTVKHDGYGRLLRD